MKKALLIIVILAAAFAVGCSQQKEEIIPEFNVSADGKIDMNGTEFIFGTAWLNEYLPVIGYSSVGDKMRVRYAAVKEEFNAVFSVVETSDSTAIVATNTAAGLHSFDLLDVHGSTGYTLYKGGYLYPLDDIGTIDLTDDKWGPVRFRQYGIYNGVSYGFYPWDWEFLPQFEGVLLFNNEYILRAGLESPYEIKERGDWSWENFKAYLEKCAEAYSFEGIVPLYHNGFDRMGKTAIFSNGVKLVNENSDGTFSFGFDCEESYKALEYLKELLDAGLMESGDQTKFAVDKTGVFLSCESYIGTLYSEGSDNLPSVCLDNYGFIDFPYGPDASSDTVSAYVFYSRRLLWAISVTPNDHDDLGIVLDYVFEPLDGTGEAAWKDYAKSMIFHHQEGYECFVNMCDRINYDYSAQLLAVADKLSTAMSSVVNGRAAASTTMSSIRDAVQAEIDKNVTWIYHE